MGFTLTENEFKKLVEKNPKNKEVIFPFLNGNDFNSNYDHKNSRLIINFGNLPLENYPLSEKNKNSVCASDYPDCLKIVEERVKEEREKLADRGASGRDRAKRWWQFSRPTLELYNAISEIDKTIALSQVTKYTSFSFVRSNQVFSHALVIIATDKFFILSIISSFAHEHWSFHYSGSLGQTLIEVTH